MQLSELYAAEGIEPNCTPVDTVLNNLNAGIAVGFALLDDDEDVDE